MLSFQTYINEPRTMPLDIEALMGAVSGKAYNPSTPEPAGYNIPGAVIPRNAFANIKVKRTKRPAPVAAKKDCPLGDRPDLVMRGGVCGMVSLAYVAGISKSEAVKAYNKANGSRRRSASTVEGRENALKLLGIKYKFESRSIKVSHFASEMKPGALYMIRVKNHAMVMKDGHCFDQGGARPVSKCRFRNHRITHIHEIIGR